MLGQTISHYKILEKLGEGGMGVVYKAQDTSLERTVAIKFLSARALLTEEDKTRFAREAKAAARLSHSNVATVFEFAEGQDPISGQHVSFIVMEYVEGAALSKKIAERPLPLQDAITTTIAVADALARAHDSGIVHRDIKPDNIMISSQDDVKVMDFGKRPFDATYEQALVYQILNAEPEPPTSLRSNVPLDLERIVQKLLQKDSSKRYQSASGLLVDLRSVRTILESGKGPAAPRGMPPGVRHSQARKHTYLAGGIVSIVALVVFFWKLFSGPDTNQITSLAVLPFENITPNSDQEYFADGMTDQLISELCKIQSVRVISRTSAMQFKGTRQSIPDIAKTLNVEGIVTATVFRSGDRMRVNAQLVRARDEANLWGDSYERRNADVLDLTSTLARSIAAEIQAALTPAELQGLSESRTVVPEAFDLVARANFLLTSSADRQNLEKGLELMQKATGVDPTYVDSYIGIAYAFLSLHSFGYRTGPEISDQAMASLNRAMTLDTTRGRAYTLLGQILWIRGDIAGCMAAHVKAVTLSPNDGLVRTLYSWILMAEGRFDEGIKEAQIAVTLDPLSHFARCNLMAWYYCDHRFEDARREALSILEMDPHWVPAQEMLMWVAYREGRLGDAVSEARKLWLMSDSLAVPEGLSWPQYERWIVSTLEDRKRDYDVGMLAMYYGVKGDKDKAMATLERAAEVAHPITLCLFYPEFDSLRSDPRFAEFVSRINLPVAAYCNIGLTDSPPDSTNGLP